MKFPFPGRSLSRVLVVSTTEISVFVDEGSHCLCGFLSEKKEGDGGDAGAVVGPPSLPSPLRLSYISPNLPPRSTRRCKLTAVPSFQLNIESRRFRGGRGRVGATLKTGGSPFRNVFIALTHDCSLNTAAAAVTVPSRFVTRSVIASSASDCFPRGRKSRDKPRTKGKTEKPQGLGREGEGDRGGESLASQKRSGIL